MTFLINSLFIRRFTTLITNLYKLFLPWCIGLLYTNLSFMYKCIYWYMYTFIGMKSCLFQLYDLALYLVHVLSSSSMREILIEVLYSDSVMPNKFSVINIFKDNYMFIIKRKDICWFYACFLLKTNLFLIKLFNIL